MNVATPRKRQSKISRELPYIMKRVAKVLREEGCPPSEVRAGLLAICGVQVEGVRPGAFRTFE